MGTLLRVLVRSLPLIVLLEIMASFAIGQAPRANFSTHAEQVLVNATVVNAKSQFVFDLRRSDFLLRVDRKETPIAAFSLEDEPVSAAIVIDASRSMKPAVKAAQATFNDAAQDLILRVSKAYFSALLASDTLSFAEAKKRANKRHTI